jgi:pimeloyl-ACP methyl ester carboxylesterase
MKSRSIGKSVGLLVILAALASACATTNQASKEDLTKWYYKSPDTDQKLLIFIHGFTGDLEDTWTNHTVTPNVHWPALIHGDEAHFDKFDVLTLGYPSYWVLPSPDCNAVAQKLIEKLRVMTIQVSNGPEIPVTKGLFQHYKRVYIIAHSLGGIIAKDLLRSLNEFSAADRKTVKGVLFFGTPIEEIYGAAAVSHLTFNQQLSCLKDRNYYTGQNNHWSNFMIGRDENADGFPKAYCAYETDALVLLKVVPDACDKPRTTTADATPAYDAPPGEPRAKPMPGSHTQIVKPLNRSATSYVWASECIDDADRIADLKDAEAKARRLPKRTGDNDLGTSDLR